jgi:aspartate/methionine/tyrosine aminotransferase
MKIEEFKLERWLLEKSEIDVGGGGVVKFQLKDLVTDIDYEQLLNYGPTNGSEALRSQVASWYPGIEADNVLITSGTSEANLLCNLHLLSPGDEYLAIHPVYEQTTGFAKYLDCRIRKVNLEKSNAWRLNLDSLKKQVTGNTKVIFFDNPNNPTGSCISKSEMQEICEIAADIDAYVVCDNALRGSELDGIPAATPLEFYEKES